jgi:hypothetical protein
MAIGSELNAMLAGGSTGASYNLNTVYSTVPYRQFGNNRYGTCVIAERANHTMFFEKAGHGRSTVPSEAEVVTQYFKETGGRDKGLNLLNSLNVWQKNGWKVGSRTLKIRSKAAVSWKNHATVMACIRSTANLGLAASLRLPMSASTQWRAHQPWSVVSGATGRANGWGCHVVHIVGYVAGGLVCRTWGTTQTMTWGFWDMYCSACYAVMDAPNA